MMTVPAGASLSGDIPAVISALKDLIAAIDAAAKNPWTPMKTFYGAFLLTDTTEVAWSRAQHILGIKPINLEGMPIGSARNAVMSVANQLATRAASAGASAPNAPASSGSSPGLTVTPQSGNLPSTSIAANDNRLLWWLAGGAAVVVTGSIAIGLLRKSKRKGRRRR